MKSSKLMDWLRFVFHNCAIQFSKITELRHIWVFVVGHIHAYAQTAANKSKRSAPAILKGKKVETIGLRITRGASSIHTITNSG